MTYPMKVRVYRHDGAVELSGAREDVIEVIPVLCKAGTLNPRWTVAGVGEGVAICWPMGARYEN